MGGCCASAEASNKSAADKKFTKGGDNDITSGPVKKRGCTDVICTALFIAHWVCFLTVTFAGLSNGNPSKLYSPRDYRGDYCGVKTQWKDGTTHPDLEKKAKQIMMMNVSSTVDIIAKQLVCSTAAENALTSVLTVTQLQDYRCACCKTPCAGCDGSLEGKFANFASDSALSTGINARMTELTALATPATLYQSSGSNGDLYQKALAQSKKYFVNTCVEKCTDVLVPRTSARTYTYSPYADIPWYHAWYTLKTNTAISATIRGVMNSSFTFPALDGGTCPYATEFCVPFPGIEFEEIVSGSNKCELKMLAAGAAAVGEAASDALKSSGVANAAEDAKEGLGEAVGDVLTTMDTFAVVCVLAFAIGLIFMVLLRFFIGCCVWTALILVGLLFLSAGFVLYISSGQCAGDTLFESSKQTADAAVSAVSAVATGTSCSSESFSGNGADYRGCQTKTKSGRNCQAWAAQTPQSHNVTAAVYTTAGLTSNYCRNPLTTATTIWCFTADSTRRWENCNAIGVLQGTCPNGYKVDTEDKRMALKVFAWIFWIIFAIWLLTICCICKRIRLAIAINKVAAQFVFETKSVLLVPIVQILVGIMWLVTWVMFAAFLLSQVPEGYTSTDPYSSHMVAYGTSEDPGKCTDTWPVGGVWRYSGNMASESDACTGNMGDISAANFVPSCWKCFPPRYIMDLRFAFSFFSFLWNNAFLIAIGQCVIAGACGVWFFAPVGQKSDQPSVRIALKNCFRYHLGSLAFGSFILAVVQFIRYLLKYFEQQAKAQKNKVMAMVLRILGYLVWCFENCVKFLNKNAYIQVALMGTNFCTSAKNAFFLIARNCVRFAVVATLGQVIHLIGVCFIMAATVIMGIWILQVWHEDASPIIPGFLYAATGYLVAKLYMNVFQLAVDTMLQCFIATEEMDEEKDFVPAPLASFLSSCPPAAKPAFGEGK